LTVGIVFILAPKNSGLKAYTDKSFSFLSNLDSARIIQARGEDIPLLLQQYFENKKKAIGLTGEDLFQEFNARFPENAVEIIKKIYWNDSEALFSKPVLCLLGSKQISKPSRITVYISSKYAALANSYLSKFEKKGFSFKKVFINGCVESSASEGLADWVIDIVYSGKTLKRAGLKILDRITESDFVILGGKSNEAKN
jgi:ATP phosphoribosyltransferase